MVDVSGATLSAPRSWLIALVALGLGLAPAVAQAAAVVDEATAVTQFLATSPEVRAAASAVAAARAELVTAGVWANPTVITDREQVFTAGGPTEQHRLGFQAQLPVTGARAVRLQVAEAGVAAAEARARQATFSLALAFRASFAAAADAQSRVAVLEAHDASFRRLLRIVEARRRAGESAGADALRARLAAAEVGSRVAGARAEAEAALGQLAGAGGRPVDGALRAAPVPPPPPADVLIAHALRARADLAALDAEREAARLAGALAGRRRWPEPQLAAGMKQTNEPTVQGLGYTVGLSWPVPVLDRAQGELAQAQAAMAGIEARLAATRSRVQAEIPGARAALVTRLAARDAFIRDGLPRVPALLAASETAYREGESTLDALLRAHEAVLDARLRAIGLDGEARAAQHELERLVGDPLASAGRETP